MYTVVTSIFESSMRACRISREDRKLIISRLLQGVSIKNIVLWYEHRRGAKICRQIVWCLLKHYHTHGSTSPLPKSGRPTKLTCGVLNIIESTMQADDETTARELEVKLQGLGISMSRCTILKGCRSLDWSHRGSAYCQLIRDVNKQKCLEWALAHRSDTFHDVIWSNETTVQLVSLSLLLPFGSSNTGSLGSENSKTAFSREILFNIDGWITKTLGLRTRYTYM